MTKARPEVLTFPVTTVNSERRTLPMIPLQRHLVLLLSVVIALFVGCGNYGLHDQKSSIPSGTAPVLYLEMVSLQSDLLANPGAIAAALKEELHLQGIRTTAQVSAQRLRCDAQLGSALSTDSQIVAETRLRCTLLRDPLPHHGLDLLEASGFSIGAVSGDGSPTGLASQAIRSETRAQEQALSDAARQMATQVAALLSTPREL